MSIVTNTALFYLGTHHPHWLASARVPLFVSRRALGRYRKCHRAAAPWALDSGGFTELGLHGAWVTSPAAYATEARHYRDEVGLLAWAAPQDWMCEPLMLRRTGLSVSEHQTRTITNYLELQSIAPDVPWIPVLQGWVERDYLSHVDAYYSAGVTLAKLPLVGIGSVCRRQATGMVAALVAMLTAQEIRLHGFGVKAHGLRRCAHTLVSADSMAWSYNARRHPALPGHRHKSCANCLVYALAWRGRLLTDIARVRDEHRQIDLVFH
jgi:hypothetical protein